MEVFKCNICGNTDLEYTGIINGNRYCRLCLRFVNTDGVNDNSFFNEKILLEIPYELTNEQIKVSDELISEISNNRNCYIHAVCGAGKTEIVLELIEKFLKDKKKVGFAIPRKDVVIELYFRVKELFKNTKIIAVYGGNTNDLIGDLILLTTHQLYRYKNFFDLLILDEADAFPFKNNLVLQQIFKNSIKGNYVIMSATYDNDSFFIKECKKIELLKRFHNNRLPIPKIKIASGVFKLFLLMNKIKYYVRNKLPCIVFVPTIELSKQIRQFLNIFIKSGYYINSKSIDRQIIINSFKKSKYTFLVSTMVLERGVTIPNLQVIVYNANSSIYDKNSLIQISGRVGRKKDYPYGEILYLANYKTKEMSDSISELNNINKEAFGT